MKKLIFNLFALLLISLSVIAQEKESRPFQVSFLYPLGINGTNTQVASDGSFNVLWGVNGGVNYFELGGIANVNNGNVTGGQIAGITNVTKGESNGIIVSGITNFNSSSAKGLQLAGINNYTNNEVNGAQISGISNISGGDMNGAQIGLINTVRGKMTGGQVGLINYTDSLSGTQVGLINVVKDGAKGTPIGLINVVKNGYYAVEVGVSETIWGNVNFKMGTQQFYTIFKGGYTQYNDKDVTTFGAGFGTSFQLAKRVNLALDLSANQIVYDGKLADTGLNLLNKADLNIQVKLAKNIGIYVGPSLNVYTTDYKLDGNEMAGTLDIPEHTFYDETSKHGTRTAIWIGGQAGLNFTF
ncbi:LA_2272 family surface repeat-containing protein [Flammeovirga sp. SJP92]|uniref:LA_2272 family surface repeat-containing protein n=1 Tax=Flammeovirga sp. SJP92 TaxID=1775430 RepID=UPI0007872C56|nr:hypothetical protein [Flammeovirga sp. SJP92]KXX68468.1 hypothetical protein AVL50_22135 [Flammeovirga sp. SJP92]